MPCEMALIADYVAREVDADAFEAIFEEMEPRVFGDIARFSFWSVASEADRAARDRLKTRLGDGFRLQLVVYRGEEVVGWTTGTQVSGECYDMNSSGVLPEHRGRGIYSALLRVLLDRLGSEGFQIVTSHHHVTNGAVLVPKIKAGFVISGFEINDIYGLLVTLHYFFDPRRREAFEFRVGHSRPGAELREAMGLNT